MLPSQTRIATWITWFVTAWASLVSLPRLLGDEPPTVLRLAKRPTAIVTDITPLPEEIIQQEVSTSRELQLLVPWEVDPDSTPPKAATPAPTFVADVEPQGEADKSRQPVILQPIDLPVEESPVKGPLPAQTVSGQPVPAQQSSSLKLAPPEEPAPATTLAVPPIPLPNAPQAAPLVGPAVKYWIVSSRCCRQTQHKCGVSCRFVCHAITEDCRCLAVNFEDVIAGQIPGAPTCVMIHGSFTRMSDVWEDSDCTYRWLRGACPQVPLNFIYYTWPSEGPFALLPHNAFTTPVPNLDFGILGHRAELNGFYVADLIGSLPASTTVSLIGHSYGARTIASALHLLGGGTVRGQPRWNPADCGQRIRVVLAAAAIEHDWLNPGDRFGCALNRAECLLSLRNECDLALALFPLRRPFSSRSLARAGFTKKDQCKLGERLIQVSELDVTPIIGTGHGWPHYCRQPAIASAITPYVFFESAGIVTQNAELTR